MLLIYILIIGNILFSLLIFILLKKEQKRNRILQAFTAGIIRSITDYFSSTDAIDRSSVPEQNTKLPISYKSILESIEHEFGKDFWMKPYSEWLKSDRQIFNDKKYGNDGFNFIYLDFFDKLVNERGLTEGEFIKSSDKVYLRDDIIVTKDNIGELRGEIAMYKDLLAGELDSKNFKKESIDHQLLLIFYNIKKECRDKLKDEILKRSYL